MGVSEAIRGGLDFLLDRQHVPAPANNINVTPTNALQSLFRRQREAPLPITPPAIFRSMLQFDDLQALLWAWTLVAVLLLFAFWTNPTEASFRPFLTDLVFRERLRILNDQDAAESPSSHHVDVAANASVPDPTPARRSDSNPFPSLLSTASYSSGPFALTFGSKVVLSVRTPPFHRKDLGLLSIVTISQSMPFSSAHDHQRAGQRSKSYARTPSRSDGSIDCTSLFIGAFGKWWVLGFGIPDSANARSQAPASPSKPGREELEENLSGMADWGVLEMRSVDPEPEPRPIPSPASSGGVHDVSVQPQSRRISGVHPSSRTASPIPSPIPPKDPAPDMESEDCLSITALVSRSQSDVADLQEQLAQVKSASNRICEALETDLEEVRAKKKEEERLRSDIKSRTRALDDSKRQVEGSRREAERRLKAVNATRALKQANIQQKKEQIEMLHKRKAAIVTRKGISAEKRQQRSAELSNLIGQAKEKADKLRDELDGLRKQVEDAQNLLQLEKMNVRNVQDAESSRDRGRMDTHPYLWNPAMDASQSNGHEVMYAHLAATPDPLVDSLARMEERAMAGQRFTSSAFDSDAGVPKTKLQSSHLDGATDLGTSVLRNAFRRANAAAAADGREMLHSAPQGHINPSLQNASNFEAIKQAFQPTVASEEDGRRSWSAFDVWQSDLRSGERQRMQWTSGAGNSSADSLPHFTASSGYLPLDRSNSAEHTSQQHSTEYSDIDQSRNLSKVKRAFRWPFRPSQVQDDVV